MDQLVSFALPNTSRSEAQRLIALPEDCPEGVRVNSERKKPGYRVRTGDVVTMSRPALRPSHIEAEELPVPIVYEDSELIVVDKPRGMVVHPAPGAASGTLVNAILSHADDLSGIGGEERPGIVHRLDKDTGGLLVVAKTDAAHRSLQAQIQAHSAQRRYLALVWGKPAFHHTLVDAPIGRHPGDRKKMAVVTDPRLRTRAAVTELLLRETFDAGLSLLEARLQTGRTHQIRVHCAYINHPVAGDPLYGGVRSLSRAVPVGRREPISHALAGLHGQALHAYQLSFDHPTTGERLTFEAGLPGPILRLLDALRAPSN